jgi:hypothetical protein
VELQRQFQRFHIGAADPDHRDASARAAHILPRHADAREDDRHVREQLVAVIEHELERVVGHRDDEIDAAAKILAPDVFGECRRRAAPEPVGLEVFRVVVDRDLGPRHEDIANGGVEHGIRRKKHRTRMNRQDTARRWLLGPGRWTEPRHRDEGSRRGREPPRDARTAHLRTSASPPAAAGATIPLHPSVAASS